MDALLQLFQESLENIGYDSALIRPDYEYATMSQVGNSAGATGLARIELAAFCRYPPTYQDACIGITLTNGLSGRENVARHRDLGAHLIFEVDGTSKRVRPWSVRSTDLPVEILPTFPTNRVREVFASHEQVWGPTAMRALKRGGALAIQSDFFDEMLLPQLAKEFQGKLRHLLEGVVTKIQNTYLRQFNSAPPVNHLFPYLFRFLTAKVFVDRRDVEEWTPALSPLQLYKKADTHLAAKRKTPVLDNFFNEDLMASVWAAFEDGLRFQNISAADLAYIYESCFIDEPTRAQLSIHSTPPELVDFVINHLPIDKLPDSGRKVMEPFCGSGAFLAAAMRRLGELNEHNLPEPGDRHNYFKKRLVGIESDPLAMEVCQLRLTLSDYPMGNGWNLYADDVFLWPRWEEEIKDTDILLANPPFHSIPQNWRNIYGTTKAVMPAEMLYRIMKHPPALMGVILPPSFLRGPDYREANRALGNTYRKVEYVELPAKVFNYARRETVILLCSERRNHLGESAARPHVTVTAKQVNQHSLEKFYQNGEASWTRTQVKSTPLEDHPFQLLVDPPGDIWEFLANSPRLVDVTAGVHMGIHWRPRTDGLSKTALRTDVVREVPQADFHPGCEKMRGCLFPYRLCTAKYLSLKEEDQDPANRAWKHPWKLPKVVCNRHRYAAGSLWRLAACADTEGWAFSQAYIAIWPKANIAPCALAAVLSNPLANAFVFDHTPGPDNHVGVIRTIPLPPLDSLVPGGEIDQLSGKIHVLNAEYFKLDSSKVHSGALRESLLRLDAVVLEAYGLPAELERKLLDRFHAEKQQVYTNFRIQSEYIKPSFKEDISLKDYLAITLDWKATNKRRGELIDKEYITTLNDAEVAELDRLQKLADQFINLEGIYRDLNANPLIEKLKQKGLWKE